MSFFLMGENAAVMQPASLSPIPPIPPILTLNDLSHSLSTAHLHRSEQSHHLPLLQTTPSIDIACQQKIWSAAHLLRQHNCCIDIVPGMNNLTAIFDPLLHSGVAMLEKLEHVWMLAQAEILSPRTVTIAVDYGANAGPDLEHVAHHTGLSQQEVIRLHTSAHYVVYFLGFQPGFAYMGGLPEQLATPRRAEPRLRVPAGSVGIGGAQTGIYPADSPGGWQLIGHTKTVLFNPQINSTASINSKNTNSSESSANSSSTVSSPTLFAPGDIVRFIDASS